MTSINHLPTKHNLSTEKPTTESTSNKENINMNTNLPLEKNISIEKQTIESSSNTQNSNITTVKSPTTENAKDTKFVLQTITSNISAHISEFAYEKENILLDQYIKKHLIKTTTS